MSERYYLPEPIRDNQAILTGDEAHHLSKVMRGKTGDEIFLFNGLGTEYLAKITDITKNQVQLEILKTETPQTEPRTEVSIAVALPKGDRQKWMIEKLTELGCKRVIPLKTERSIVQCGKNVVERLRRQVLEASKQSGRSTLMEITEEMSLEQLAGWKADEIFPMIAHPRNDGDFGQTTMRQILFDLQSTDKFLIVIGPVGGLTYEEVEQMVKLGFKPVDLGPRLFRVETAAISMTAGLILAGQS